MRSSREEKMRRFVLVGLLASFLIAGVLYHFAAQSPDGLERVMEERGVAEGEPVAPAPFPDYEIPGLGPIAGRTAAGLAGTALAFALPLVLMRVLLRKRAQPPRPE